MADCSCSQWSKSIVSQALRSRIDLFSSTNAYYNQTAVRNTYGSTFRIQYLRSRVNPEVAKTHRRGLGILAEAGRTDTIWAPVHYPTPHSAREQESVFRIRLGHQILKLHCFCLRFCGTATPTPTILCSTERSRFDCCVITTPPCRF